MGIVSILQLEVKQMRMSFWKAIQQKFDSFARLFCDLTYD